MKSVLITAFAIPILALAASARIEGSQGQSNWRQRNEARMRIMRVVGLAEALELDEAQALRVNEVMRPYDERRTVLEMQNAEAAKVIKRASDGDSGAIGQLDQALQRVFENRAQIQQLSREMFEAVGRDLTPQQRAKMAIFFANFGNEVRNLQLRAQARARADALKAAADRARENAQTK